MLKQLGGWFLYGEKQIFIFLLCFMAMGLLVVSCFCLKPFRESYQHQKNELLHLESTLASQKKALKAFSGDEPNYTVKIPQDALGATFHLPSRTYQKKVYYTGNTDQVLHLLFFILHEGYEITGFRLEKYDHNIVLVIFL